MFDAKTCSMIVPVPGAAPLALPLKEIFHAEERVKEVAFVNAHKAPELLACFNIAYLDINDHLSRLELALHMVQKAAKERAAIVILDEVPRILKEKGISTARSPGGSEDQREAILAQDAVYSACVDRVEQVKAMLTLMKGKKEAIVMAYNSVKKILGGEQHGSPDLTQNRNLSAGGPQSGPAVGTYAGFGGAR
jgi:hypothetical protein